MNIKDFLLARIAEDEAAAGGEGYSSWHTVECGLNLDYWANDRCECDGPTRVLAECAAKRAIINTVTPYLDGNPRNRTGELLAHLAAVYSDHPDYGASWALPT